MTEKSSRGFEQYGTIQISYGHTVRVYESSAASGPHIWMKTQLAEDQGNMAAEEATAHMDLLQAMTLRGLLDEFIEGVPERWTHGNVLHAKADKAWREANPGLVLNQRRRSCQCCAFGNHEFRCACDGKGCCHPHHHKPSVPEHRHDFVGDSDTCVGIEGCPLTYAEHKAAQREGAMQEALERLGEVEPEPLCGVCGHPEERHTHTLPEEGYQAYCAECPEIPGVDEYHEYAQGMRAHREADMNIGDLLSETSVRDKVIRELTDDPERSARLDEVQQKLRVAVLVAVEALRPVMVNGSDDAAVGPVATLITREFVEHVVREALRN